MADRVYKTEGELIHSPGQIQFPGLLKGALVSSTCIEKKTYVCPAQIFLLPMIEESFFFSAFMYFKEKQGLVLLFERRGKFLGKIYDAY